MATRADPTEAAAPTDTVDRATKWAIALLFVVLFIPGSFNMGVRMTPYRLYLIAMAIPAVLRYRADPTIRFNAVDALMFLACAWRSLAVLANHGLSEIPFAGSSFMELFFGYLVGRVYIRNAPDYRYLFKCFLIFILVSLPFALYEAITRERILRNLASNVFFFTSEERTGGGQVRFGLLRPRVSFEHALLFGTFCAIGLANVYYIYKDRYPRNIFAFIFVVFMTLVSISSSSIINITLQIFMMIYNRIFLVFKTRWFIIAIAAILFFAAFGYEIIKYIAIEISLNPVGGAERLGQIEWGLKEVERNPFFGIGNAEWRRPFWQSSVFDNFWLANTVRFGIPASVFLVLTLGVHILQAALAPRLSEDERAVRQGHLIALVALGFTLGMHGMWDRMAMFCMFYVGAGVWLYDTPRAAPPSRWRRSGAATGEGRAHPDRRPASGIRRSGRLSGR